MRRNVDLELGISGSLFEDDYLIRTLGKIAQDPETALTELVANAWDAGAHCVSIFIPDERGGLLVVEDDGHGMTSAHFKSRWMKLGYNRNRHQGRKVEFPKNRRGKQRLAYGHNGVGRHGLLCFSDTYSVDTWRDAEGSQFIISTHSNEMPFYIEKETSYSNPDGSGTRLSVAVERHLPNPERIAHVLSAKFLHDPEFKVTVNGKAIDLSEHQGLIRTDVLTIINGLTVKAYVVDSSKVSNRSSYHGVAFWVNGRLVGIPGWSVGNVNLLDRRWQVAKRYAIVIEAGDEWIDSIESDWSKFKDNENTKALNESVKCFVFDVLKSFSEEIANESSEEAVMKNKEDFDRLGALGKVEVIGFAKEIAKQMPTINPETLSLAVRAAINLERSRKGAALLEKIISLQDSDVDGLDKLLSQWTIRDALTVLDEIDQRLAVVEAIAKLCSDEKTDELHTLHPLVTQARWLFGPEFDSSEFSSNVTLRTVAKQIFKKDAAPDGFINHKNRPDLVIRANSTYSLVGTEEFDSHSGGVCCLRDVLIIELKRGKFPIGREEMNQADGYVQDLLAWEGLDGNPFIRAFVVGYEIDSKTQREKTIGGESGRRGRVLAMTYEQLVRTAHQRFFRLKEKIPERYEELTGDDLVKKVLSKPEQAAIILPSH